MRGKAFSILTVVLLAIGQPGAALAQSVAPQPAPTTTPATLEQRVRAVLAAAPQGTRFGVLVTRADGSVVVAIDPDQRFIPASNTKLFTTALALARLPGLVPGTRVRLEPGPGTSARGRRDVVLLGRGDPRMSSAPDCTANCLRTLADAVARETRSVGDVIGDATLFPDQRWSPGMSWNNIGTDSGTAVAALSLDDNELPVVVTPTTPGQPPTVTVSPYLTVINEAQTVASGPRELQFESTVNGRVVRVYGRIPVGAPYRERLGIDDPALYAAWTFKRMLAERGVRVRGEARSRYRPAGIDDGPEQRQPLAATVRPDDLAALDPSSLLEDVVIINKVSQNLHAELLLRRVALEDGDGTLANGAAAIEAMLTAAGVPRAGYDYADGSGMSTYNRVSPRATVALLRWAKGQPWGANWRASLPLGGTDGTLRRRFIGTPLAGNVQAKTGTLNATNALGGYFRAASGGELIFAIYANDVPDGQSALAAMDQALVLIAAAN